MLQASNESDITSLADMKHLAQWVCYDTNKKPYTPGTRFGAKANDPRTWGTYTDAVRQVRANPDQFVGVGFELLKEQRLVLIDFDHCIDDHGTIAAWVQDELTSLNSYTERSPSGRGLHVYARGQLPANLPASGDGIEMYDCLRYTTITEDHLDGTPDEICDRAEEVSRLAERVRAARAAHKKQAVRPPLTLVNRSPVTREQAYATGALKKALADLHDAPEGSRNNALFSSAAALGELVASGWLGRGEVERELAQAARRIGLSDMEIAKTLASGMNRGMSHPREGVPAKVPSALHEFEATDTGNAEAVQFLYGQMLHYTSARGWLVWCGTHWEADGAECQVNRMIIDTLRRRRKEAVDAEKEDIIKVTRTNNAVVNNCRARLVDLPGIYIEHDRFDADPALLNTQSGVVNLRTGEIFPHAPEYLCSSMLATPVGTLADATAWVSFLTGAVGENLDMVSYIQKAVGYCLTGKTSEEVLFYLYGPSRSGKGTFVEALLTLLGKPLSCSRDFNTFTGKHEKGDQNFDLAALQPARFVVASESNKYQTLNPAKIKSLTGGDDVTAAFKGKDAFTYRPQYKVWLVSNHPINADADDDALWGRVHVVEFPHSHLGQADTSLKERMKTPAVQRGILWWAIEGAKRWYREGLGKPASVERATRTQRSLNDTVQQWLDERCIVRDDAWTTTSSLTASYVAWCEHNNYTPLHAKGFAYSMKQKGWDTSQQKKVQGVNARGVSGLSLASFYSVKNG